MNNKINRINAENKIKITSSHCYSVMNHNSLILLSFYSHNYRWCIFSKWWRWSESKLRDQSVLIGLILPSRIKKPLPPINLVTLHNQNLHNLWTTKGEVLLTTRRRPVRCTGLTEHHKDINHGHYQAWMLFKDFKLIVNV